MKINWWPIKYKGVQFIFSILKPYLHLWGKENWTCQKPMSKSTGQKTPTHDLHEDMKHSTNWVGKSSVSCHLFQWSYFPMDHISNDPETFRHSRPHFQFSWKSLGAFVYSVIHIPPQGVASCFWIDGLVLSIPEMKSHQPNVLSQMIGVFPCLQDGLSLWELASGWFWRSAVFTDYSFRFRWILPTWHKPAQGTRNPELHNLGNKTRIREPYDPRSFSIALFWPRIMSFCKALALWHLPALTYTRRLSLSNITAS